MERPKPEVQPVINQTGVDGVGVGVDIVMGVLRLVGKGSRERDEMTEVSCRFVVAGDVPTRQLEDRYCMLLFLLLHIQFDKQATGLSYTFPAHRSFFLPGLSHVQYQTDRAMELTRKLTPSRPVRDKARRTANGVRLCHQVSVSLAIHSTIVKRREMDLGRHQELEQKRGWTG